MTQEFCARNFWVSRGRPGKAPGHASNPRVAGQALVKRSRTGIVGREKTINARPYRRSSRRHEEMSQKPILEVRPLVKDEGRTEREKGRAV